MKKSMKVAFVILVCKVFCGSLFAYGGGHRGGHGEKPRKGHRFIKMDTNGDGQVSMAEWMEGSKSKFQKIDANGDGQISVEEHKAYHKMKRERRGK